MMQSNQIVASWIGLAWAWAWAGLGLAWLGVAWAYQSNTFEQQRVVATRVYLFKRQIKILHHFFKHVQTRLMYDALNKTIASLFSETFELFKKMMQSSKVIAPLFLETFELL